jgi:hypothetical protein
MSRIILPPGVTANVFSRLSFVAALARGETNVSDRAKSARVNWNWFPEELTFIVHLYVEMTYYCNGAIALGICAIPQRFQFKSNSCWC